MNDQPKEICQNAGVEFLDYRNHLNAKANVSNSKLHLNKKVSAKLSSLFLNYILESYK